MTVVSTAATSKDATTGDERQLRLGLVLYGGVSLAIYMHGTVKEIHRLVRASAAPPDDDRAATPTEQVWRRLLEEKAGHDGVATRVVVDVITGTSAGGINGVYLAKALAHDLPQEPLRDLWLNKGDIGKLIRGPKWVPWQLRAMWAVPMVWRKPLLQGDEMAGWLFGALEEMDERGESDGDEPRSLVPSGQQMHLFVTVTDFYGYDREALIDDPPVVHDRRHRHVLTFTFGDGHDDFQPGGASNGPLAFAARTTSCFPGGFPPVSLAAFEGDVRRHNRVELDLSAMESTQLFRHYPLARTTATARFFIDGGVLDNFPFGHAISAIRQQPAPGEVDRRLLYLDPDPAQRDAAAVEEEPTSLATVLGSLAGLPRHEPILDDILNLSATNQRVRQIRDVIETNWPGVAQCVLTTLHGVDLADPPADMGDHALARSQRSLHREAMRQVGPSYTTYLRTKLGAVVDGWADTACRRLEFPDDSNQALFVRQALRGWADRAGLFQKTRLRPVPRQVRFLRDFDLLYSERRLRFVIAGLSWWYDPANESSDFSLPTRSQLDTGKARLYEAVAELRAAMRGQDMPTELTRQLSACFHEDVLDRFLDRPGRRVDEYLEHKQVELDQLVADLGSHLNERFRGFASRVYGDMHKITAAWQPEARRRLMIRYMGFPLWDAVLFPMQWAADVGERDHVEVVRLSPRDARLLDVDSQPKLAGAGWHHFGAFLDRPGREKDYLWGRLDAAERLVGILLGRDHGDVKRWCSQLFLAILDEEEQALPGARDLIDRVRDWAIPQTSGR
ncbi:MAG TPA: patatin-like protein [Nitriliruptorales bacterium]|nr:patatin-like protein [Nitriliruptorales bacterium]